MLKYLRFWRLRHPQVNDLTDLEENYPDLIEKDDVDPGHYFLTSWSKKASSLGGAGVVRLFDAFLNLTFCLLLILTASLLIYVLAPFKWPGPVDVKFDPDQPANFAESCQFIEVPLSGAEASVHSGHFRLRGIVAVLRHGERSPLITVNSRPLPSCSLIADTDRKAFGTYTKLVETEGFRNFLKIDPNYSKFQWRPHPEQCKSSELTAEGALQLRKLGSFLHEKYGAAGLFKSIQDADILVSSSQYSRTFQSAIAFLSTFLYTLPDLKEVKLVASNTTYFCLDPSCNCPNHDKLWFRSRVERVQDFQAKTSRKLYDRIQLLGQIAGLERVDNPIRFLDLMLGNYICRRGALPCNADGDCFTANDYQELAHECWNIAERMFEKTSMTARSMNLIRAWTMLKHLTNATASTRKLGKTIIKILNGHDISIEALVHVFGIKQRLHPFYASRFVFEIYESSKLNKNETVFVRIMYNGNDHTNDVEFCRPLVNEMCRASVLEEFTERGILKLQNLDNFQQLCE